GSELGFRERNDRRGGVSQVGRYPPWHVHPRPCSRANDGPRHDPGAAQVSMSDVEAGIREVHPLRRLAHATRTVIACSTRLTNASAASTSVPRARTWPILSVPFLSVLTVSPGRALNATSSTSGCAP